jgi:Tetratricopeptide repeat
MALDAKLRGDRPAADEHHAKALRAAAQVTRIRANRASALVGEAHYAEALLELRPVVELAHETGYIPMLALAMLNEGEALRQLGQLTEALTRLERSASFYQRMGSHSVAYPLTSIGDIHRLRGRANLARTAYEEAIRISEPPQDLQALVPALTGLARVLAADDGPAAIALAERAVTLERGPDAPTARLALGWVALGNRRSRSGGAGSRVGGRCGPPASRPRRAGRGSGAAGGHGGRPDRGPQGVGGGGRHRTRHRGAGGSRPDRGTARPAAGRRGQRTYRGDAGRRAAHRGRGTAADDGGRGRLKHRATGPDPHTWTVRGHRRGRAGTTHRVAVTQGP